MRFVAGLVFVTVLAFLAGCAQPERDYIIGDESFTAEERASIETGKAYIEAVTGRTVPEIRWEPLPNDDSDNVIVRGKLPSTWCGDGKFGAFNVILDVEKSKEWHVDLAADAAHELGHGLGMHHHASPGLMNPAAFSLMWTADDQAYCTEMGVCR